MTSRTLTALARVVAITALAVGVLATDPVGAQTNPFQRGPAPTPTSVTQPQGPFAIQTQAVTRQAGFNGGTIYFPTSTSEGTFGAVVATPGFTEGQNVMRWAGQYLGSNGFVVLTIQTNTILDFPSGRANQAEAAMNWLTTQSPVANRIDRNRTAFIGHSMGGGASLENGRDLPDTEAVVGFQPWHIGQNFSTVQTPSLIVAAQSDPIAPKNQYARPFYNQIPASAEKAYLEITGGHFLGTSFNATQARSTLSWLKRYVDNDTRYDQFLCPPPSGGGIVTYLHTCPTGS
jgi:dienelactone hydrolase